jgi:lipopolysaccharide cholinephosphotransferase
MRFLDADELKETRRAYKDAFVDEGFKRKIWDEDMIRFVAPRVRANLLERIEKEGIDPEKELKNRNWELLDDLFEEYRRYQFSAAFTYWYRFINLPENVEYTALMSMIDRNGDYGKVSRLMTRYRERNGELSAAMQRIQKLFDALFAVSSNRVYGRIEEGLKALEHAEKEYPDNRQVRLERLKYDIIKAGGGRVSELTKAADALLEEYPGNADAVKAKGDILWNSGDKKAAMDVYDELYDKTNNGFIRLDIERKRKEEKAC